MIETFRGIWRFAGEEQRNIRRSVIACFLGAVFQIGRASCRERVFPLV